MNWGSKTLFIWMILLSFTLKDLKGEEQVSSSTIVEANSSANRAELSWKSLVKVFGTSNPGIYWNDLPDYPNRRLAYVWTHSVIMQASLDISDSSIGNSSFLEALAGLKSYRLKARGTIGYSPILNPLESQPRWWDDNGVVGLVLIRGARKLKDIRDQLVEKAIEIMPFIERGMAKDGGVFWYENNPHPLRGISSTGSTSELAMRLLLSYSSNKTFLEFTEKNLKWLNSHLLDTSTHYYWNSWYENISDVPSTCYTGTHVCNWMYTYNEAFVINFLVLLYEYTSDEGYLEQAVQTAQASLKYFEEDILWKQPPAFNGIYFRSLLLLNRFRPDSKYKKMMKVYLDLAWDTARDKESGLFVHNGIGMSTPGQFGSIDQASFVQMFSLIDLE